MKAQRTLVAGILGDLHAARFFSYQLHELRQQRICVVRAAEHMHMQRIQIDDGTVGNRPLRLGLGR